MNRLYYENARPVFCTGHLLCGALATICSIDLRLSLDIPSDEICVATFESPRCGNVDFRTIYDVEVPVHWRYAHQTDVITCIPKMGGYRHVGKQVLLTDTGNLFLKSNGLEVSLWSGKTSGTENHAMSSRSRLFVSSTWTTMNQNSGTVQERWC